MYAVCVLTAINLVNYLDRYLIAGMVTPVKEHFGASDSQIGLLTSAFLLVYMIASPIFGAMARRHSRTMILAGGVLTWSLATIGSGLAANLALLFVARGIVGIGEAAYSTVGPALIAGHFEPSRRATVLSIFYAAIPVGSALSYIAAGHIEQRWGWQWVFMAGGLPGLFLAASCLWLREAKPDPQAHEEDPPQGAQGSHRLTHSLRTILSSRQFTFATGGYIAFTFAFGALAVWMPHYLETQRGWSRTSATTSFGLILAATGVVGTIGGGWLARVWGGGSRACLLLCAVCMALAIPATAVALYAHADWLIVAALVIASTLSFATQGPVNAVIVNAVNSTLRPLAVGLSVMLIHLLGDVPSPWLVGEVSDSSVGMKAAMAFVPMAMGVAAVTWFVGGNRR